MIEFGRQKVFLLLTYVVYGAMFWYTYRWPQHSKDVPCYKKNSSISASNKLNLNEIKNSSGNIANANVSFVLRFASVPALKEQFYCVFLRSAVFFWPPSYGSLNIVLDKESKADHQFGDKLKQQSTTNFPNIALNVFYEALPTNKFMHQRGMLKTPSYSRQLYSTFFADSYTSDSIIAYMDTDVQFLTPITREYIGLTNNGKLLVLAEGTFSGWVHSWNRSTHIALGLPLIANFMITFPQFLHRSTFENCRKHILKHTKITEFQDAVAKFYPPGVYMSPICILLTYAWFYEHDKYDWHIKTRELGATFNNKPLPKEKKIKPKETIPSIVGSSHTKKYNREFMKNGYCMATKAVGMNITGCSKVKHGLEMCDLYGDYKWPTAKTWCKAGTMEACCTEALDKHYQNVPKYYENKIFDFDKNAVDKVDQMAKDVGITCPDAGLP